MPGQTYLSRDDAMPVDMLDGMGPGDYRVGDGIQAPNAASAWCSSTAPAWAETSAGTQSGNGTTRLT